jgi:hypothetical protein
MRWRSPLLIGTILFLVFCVSPAPAIAQEDSQFARPPVGAHATSAALAPQGDAFGLGNQNLWIMAPHFAGHSNSLEYASFHFFDNPASATPQRFFAHIPLHTGAQIVQIECHIGDYSATNDVVLSFQRYSFDTNSDVPNQSFIRFFGATGTPGYEDVYFIPTASDGAIVLGEGSTRYAYYLSADVATDTSLRGCNVVWRRTVSPAPAVATYPVDVPTTHPYFRFVEALAAAGITGGCAAGSYCPDQPVTRGQMAVFLAAALGLHFPF